MEHINRVDVCFDTNNVYNPEYFGAVGKIIRFDRIFVNSVAK